MPSRKTVTSRRKRKKISRGARRKRSASASPGRFRWRYLFAGLFVVGLIYVGYLDFTIRDQFEGKRWALPARVYARALEIYPGLALRQSQLIAELERLGYRDDTGRHEPGSYRHQGNRVSFTTRPFRFWDGTEPSRRVEAVFDNGRITLLRDHNGAEMSLLRLEPPAIGGIYPRHREERVLVQLEEVPPLLQHALVAVEDRAFYDHFGVDPRAIARALLANLRAGRTVQGAAP